MAKDLSPIARESDRAAYEFWLISLRRGSLREPESSNRASTSSRLAVNWFPVNIFADAVILLPAWGVISTRQPLGWLGLSASSSSGDLVLTNIN
jgi:hypothetical protein